MIMYTVLIVEDELLVSIGLRNMISWSDLDMVIIGEARNGSEGLELYRSKHPDVILTDIKMPVMDGLEMIEQIRKEDEVTKIVVLSAYEDYELVRQAFKMGISDYILKLKMMPKDVENIICKIHQELCSYSAEQKLQLQERGQEVQAVWRDNVLEKCRDYIVHNALSWEEFLPLAEGNQLTEGGLAVGFMKVIPFGRSINKEDMQKKQIILDLVQSILSEENRGIVIKENAYQYILVFRFADVGAGEERQKRLEALLHKIHSILRTYINGIAALGISTFSDACEDLNKLYCEATAAYKEAVFLEEKWLLYGSKFVQCRYGEELKKI